MVYITGWRDKQGGALETEEVSRPKLGMRVSPQQSLPSVNLECLRAAFELQ